MNELQIVKLENTDISRWDFAMLRAELQSRLDSLEGLVYSDESIKDAKSDRAALNKVKKVIEDAGKAYRTRCLAPYEALKPQIDELVDMVEQQRSLIDDTVKNYEARQREEKEREIRRYYDRKAVVLGDQADSLYPRLFDKKWVNASTQRAKYEEGILTAINRAQADIATIRGMNSPFTDTLLAVYCETLSIEQAEAKRAELEAAVLKARIPADAFEGSALQKEGPADLAQYEENTQEGVMLRVVASQRQLALITDFMQAIGVRYEQL